ncbi:hypothetical protein F441_01032 [Phytophthora nicotianae CJ01A1]|uniref:Uncharacterized protein n=2 Tax=Phytophthora nicotianae TaxID=4792 RepID=W2P4H6_PHYNI|nr:hypothetical protein L915_00995 [Phytophthora nicotianae]ETM02627.1 hypothetical protein L917_00950 [Phytophthora nicotianae]ETM55877.1 hypothetical protein L914_00989 [Phytophthora nicotianae]ETP26216.1 hypothetical protein F441_01032 [Phytophthora nicotianae CJ01A1]
MTRKARPAGWSKPIKPSLRYWDSDAMDPDSPASIHVLLQWLTTPGNYKRWQTEKKSSLCEEIVAYLEMEGITHRDADQVYDKILRLQNKVEAATNWLIVHKHYDVCQRGEVGRVAKKRLVKMCPYYEELAAVFRGDKSTKSSSMAQKQVPTRKRCDGINDTDEEEKHAAAAQCKMTDEADRDNKQLFDSHTNRLLDSGFKCKKVLLEAEKICGVALNRKKMLEPASTVRRSTDCYRSEKDVIGCNVFNRLVFQ